LTGGVSQLKSKNQMTNHHWKYVLVTTAHRGVFYGKLEVESKDHAILHNCRNVIMFGTKGGFLELADTGPTDSSKIGATAPITKLYDITSVTICSEEANAKWDSWKSSAGK
jgi:hypothetical protein